MAYRVIIPNTGMVLGVFADEADAYKCYLKHYTTKSTEDWCSKIKRGFPDALVHRDIEKIDMAETTYRMVFD